MHELSIAYNLVEIAEQAARDNQVEQVAAVHLRLGVFAGVVKDALLFGYDVATEGTCLAGSELIIEDVPLIVYCATCDSEKELSSIQYFVCPDCGTPSTDIRQGKELDIISIEIAESQFNETETS
jgi:hydrogenase nickel incorporation protein HypA/HybF